MLLVEISINSVANYVSMEGHALTHNWKPLIIGFDAPTIGIPSDHGGYAKMEFGSITFNPILFVSDWPPPISCPITISYTDTTEAASETVFEGTAHLQVFDRNQITYSLFGPDYDETIADATAYNNTLNSVLTTILTSIAEINTVNTTYARASSPNVTYTTSGEQLAIDLASEIAQFFSHLIYIVGDTAYLVDMLLDNGSRTLTEYEFFAFPSYQYNAPISKATAGDYSRFSAYPYGSDLSETAYHTTQANIEAALDNILTIENSPRLNFSIPMIAGNFPNLGEKVNIADSAPVAGLTSYIRVRKMQFNFSEHEINLEGEGAIAAT